MTCKTTLKYLIASITVAAVASAAHSLDTRDLTLNGHAFTVEIAEKIPDIALGLAHRPYLAENAGMLLAYPPNMSQQCVWMKDALIPLSAAFFDEDGVIINIVNNMPPGSDKYHCASSKAIFVIEMNANWFAKNGITEGMKLHNLRAR